MKYTCTESTLVNRYTERNESILDVLKDHSLSENISRLRTTVVRREIKMDS